MQLEQRFALPAPPANVWAAFRDVPLLVECLPGAALTGAESDGAWPLRFDAKLGPIAAAFVGTARVTFDDAARAGRFEGSATDARTQSRVKGAASFRVEAEGETSVIVVGVDYTLTGSLAQFSRAGLVRELANALTAQFAARLAARLPQAVEASSTTPNTPLDGGPLLALVLRARWRRFVAWLLRRAPA
jgi:carbon monoxide dehydrogenase subunit G